MQYAIDRDYPALYLEELLALRDFDALDDDTMVDYVTRALVDPTSRRPSIETLLHGFLPAKHIDHVHADAICALTNHPQGEKAVREALGENFAYVNWLRPGFELSKLVGGLGDYAGVVLAWESFQTWLHWREHLDASTDEHIAEMINLGVVMLDVPVMNMAATTGLFERVGIEYEIWDSQTLEIKVPGIDPGKFWPPKRIDDPAFWEDANERTGALYTPAGGYISDPSLSAVNLAEAAKRHGTHFRFKEEIVAILKSDERVRGV
jgi:hypothetical protein